MLCRPFFSRTVRRHRFEIINGAGNCCKKSTNNSGKLHIIRYGIINRIISGDPQYIKNKCADKKCYWKNNNHGMDGMTFNVGITFHSLPVFYFTAAKMLPEIIPLYNEFISLINNKNKWS